MEEGGCGPCSHTKNDEWCPKHSFHCSALQTQPPNCGRSEHTNVRTPQQCAGDCEMFPTHCHCHCHCHLPSTGTSPTPNGEGSELRNPSKFARNTFHSSFAFFCLHQGELCRHRPVDHDAAAWSVRNRVSVESRHEGVTTEDEISIETFLLPHYSLGLKFTALSMLLGIYVYRGVWTSSLHPHSRHGRCDFQKHRFLLAVEPCNKKLHAVLCHHPEPEVGA